MKHMLKKGEDIITFVDETLYLSYFKSTWWIDSGATCETWVPLGPHRPGSRPSPTKWVRPTRRPADLLVGPTDLVGGSHDLPKTFQKIPWTT
jgi:hypothetical protein